ncbi:MAG: glycosyltransferase family 9 protein [Oscillochloridaceae bacterium]|nr:glycosyltransferase family 9 protein [Chloroflexaceae bacterium]MDW8391173.1 glycosyltransferase family 9 protein [Oscillochloridaceae bacterium]
MKLFLLRLLALLARPFIRRATPGPPRRVLVIKPDHLGDLLLATPALQALRAALPDAHISALVGPWARRMWQGLPELDTLRELPFPGFERDGARRRNRLQPFLTLLRYAVLLRREGYDAALILRDDHWWGALLALLAGIPRRVGHGSPLCAPLLSEALPFDGREHVTRQALDVAARLTGAKPLAYPGAPPLRFALTPAERAWANAWIAARLAPAERLVIIHPGTAGVTKLWPAERWAIVGDALAARPGARVLLTGGPGEEALVRQVAGAMRHPPLELAGATSISQLAALFAQAALVLGVDSGPLHLAVSQGTPTVRLFGPTDPGRFGPWGDPARHRVLRAGLACSPCHNVNRCPRGTLGPECMEAISAAMVKDAVSLEASPDLPLTLR